MKILCLYVELTFYLWTLKVFFFSLWLQYDILHISIMSVWIYGHFSSTCLLLSFIEHLLFTNLSIRQYSHNLDLCLTLRLAGFVIVRRLFFCFSLCILFFYWSCITYDWYFNCHSINCFFIHLFVKKVWWYFAEEISIMCLKTVSVLFKVFSLMKLWSKLF